MMQRTLLDPLIEWACELRFDDIPTPVVEHAKNQLFSILGAVHAGFDSDLGLPILKAFYQHSNENSFAFPHSSPTSPTQAAYLMSSWSMVHDFDDVMLGGHTGHSSVIVPLCFAASHQRCGKELLRAQIIANEISARINMCLAVGDTRGQMATHLHLIGAVIARSAIEDLPKDSVIQSVNFALSYPAKALYPAFLGSDAKVVCASIAIRTGLESIDAVLAGLQATEDILGGERGLIHTLARIPNYNFLADLGLKWHTQTNSYKAHPVCGYLSSTVEASINIARQNNINSDDIKSVDVYASIFTLGMDDHSKAYVRGDQSRISTLTFSTPFVVASALTHKQFSVNELKRESIENKDVWELAKKVKVHHDMSFTEMALTTDIPLGAALRPLKRSQILLFLASIGGKAFSRSLHKQHAFSFWKSLWSIANTLSLKRETPFSKMKKQLASKVVVTLYDGTLYQHYIEIPSGFSGSGSWSDSRKMLKQKYIQCASACVGEKNALEAAAMIEKYEKLSSEDINDFIKNNCQSREIKQCI